MFSTRCMTISEVPCSIFDAKPSYYEIVTCHCCKLYVYKQSLTLQENSLLSVTTHLQYNDHYFIFFLLCSDGALYVLS